jgi:hypothetical protein
MATHVFLLEMDEFERDDLDDCDHSRSRKHQGKELRRAERKLSRVLHSIRRMRVELAQAFARGGKNREDLARRIVDAKQQAARLREDLERRRTAAA